MTIVHGFKELAKRAGLRRSRVAAMRMCCERTALSALHYAKMQHASRILCYHSVGTPEWGVNDVHPARFRSQLELALKAGYQFVPADAIAAGQSNPRHLAITFDDGLTSVAKNAGPILSEYHIPWTLFVVANWADGRHSWDDDLLLDWRGVERAAELGATIGSHSVSHPNFGQLPIDEVELELSDSQRMIEGALGIRPTQFAIPFGQSTNWTATATAAARKVGYQQIYAQSVRRRPAGTVARTFITRFDNARIFRAALAGGFDDWEEWI